MKKDNDFMEDINNIIDERINASYLKLKQNIEYKELEKQYFALSNKLEEKVKDFESYKQFEYDLYSLQLREAYKIGIFDTLTTYIKQFKYET